METQSVHAVIHNDDLLIEILLWLPVISLFQLKSVCKRWLSLISNPTFTLRRSQISILDPPCGLLVGSYLNLDEYYILSLDIRIPGKSSLLKNPFTFGSRLHNVKILQSCNGLLLLRCNNSEANKYYVYNPCINLLKMVPQISNKTVYGTRISFDPTKSPHYKVIQAVLVNEDDGGGGGGGKYWDDAPFCQIQTYSSHTHIWTVCTGPYKRYSFLYFEDGICWNDALYWLSWNSISNHYFFKLDINVEHQNLTTIKTPTTLDGKVYGPDCKLFETCGCLLLLCREYGKPMLMDVYEMRKGYSQWLLKYHVNLNDDVSRSWTYPSVLSIVLGEREEDSFIVIKEFTKIFQYKPVLKTSQNLYDLKSILDMYCFQFIASVAGVGL